MHINNNVGICNTQHAILGTTFLCALSTEMPFKLNNQMHEYQR